MEKDNAQHTEQALLELIRMLKHLLASLKTYPKPHELQPNWAKGYNNGFESCIRNVEDFYKHLAYYTQKEEIKEATQ